MADIGPKDLIYERSGKWVTEDFCAAKLLGLRMRRPGLYGRIRTVLSLSGFIARIFTGNCCFEPSQACETQLYDLETGTWSDYLCDIYGIDPAMLPPLVPCFRRAFSPATSLLSPAPPHRSPPSRITDISIRSSGSGLMQISGRKAIFSR